jgi:hypothetical protein
VVQWRCQIWCWCQRRARTWIGARNSKVTLLSTVVAFLVWWGVDHILIGWSPLHIPIPSVWSLIAIRVRNNLAFRGGKSLSNCLCHWLDILLHGAKDRSSG